MKKVSTSPQSVDQLKKANAYIESLAPEAEIIVKRVHDSIEPVGQDGYQYYWRVFDQYKRALKVDQPKLTDQGLKNAILLLATALINANGNRRGIAWALYHAGVADYRKQVEGM
jgi:hypothetical protein